MAMNDSQVQLLLDELCTKLGFCLSNCAQTRLRTSPPSDVDTFVSAVFESGGLDPRLNKTLRRQVRETIEWHMRRWP
jgi:hypothetical protein